MSFFEALTLNRSLLIKIFWITTGAGALGLLYWFGAFVGQSLRDATNQAELWIGNQTAAWLFVDGLKFLGLVVIGGVAEHLRSSKRPLFKLLSQLSAIACLLYILPFLSFMVRLVLSFEGSGCETGYGKGCE